MKKLTLVLFFCIAIIGCTAAKTSSKSPASNDIGSLAITANIINNKIVTGKSFEITIAATENITPWQDIVIQLNSSDRRIITLNTTSCNIQYTTKSCTISATALALGSATVTVSAKNFKAVSYNIDVVKHNTISIQTNLQDNTAIIDEPFKIIIIANDPDVIKEKTTFTVKTDKPDILSIPIPNCDILPGLKQCTIDARAKKIDTGISVEVSATNFITESYGPIKISNLHILTISTNLPNNNIVVDKDFEITSSIEDINRTNKNIEVKLTSKSQGTDIVITPEVSSCLIKPGIQSCKVTAHSVGLGSAIITASADISKQATPITINSLGHNTVSIITSFPNNIVPLNKKFPITIVANDPEYVKQNVTFKVTSNDQSLLEIEAPASCTLSISNSKCSIWATSRAVGDTSISSDAPDFVESKSDLIKISDQFIFTPSLEPSGILPKDSEIIPYESIGKDITQEYPVQSIGSGIDRRGMIVNNYNYCLEDPVNLKYGSSQALFYYGSDIPKDILENSVFDMDQGNLVALISPSKNANTVNKTTANELSMHRYYGMFVIYDVLNSANNSHISQHAKDLLEVSDDDFLKYCGNAFHNSAGVGYGVLIDTAVTFDNIPTKNLFKDTYKIDDNSPISLPALLKKVTQLKEDSNKNAAVVISVNQFGGTHQELDELLKQYVSSDGLVHCDYTNINLCNQLLNEIIYYSSKYLPENTKDRNSWQLFSTYGTSSYNTYPHNINIEQLDDHYFTAERNIRNTIKSDRDNYNFLVRYQHRPFWELIDVNTKNQIKELTTKYREMVEKYTANSNIIDNCVKDISNTNINCPIAEKKMTDIRNKYTEYIDLYNKLSSIIYVDYDFNKTDVMLVPLDLDSTCIVKNSTTVPICHGKFGAYKHDSNDFSSNASCFIDTTTDKSYFNKIGHPEWKDKSIYCTFKTGPIDHTYITNFSEENQATLGHAMSYNKDVEIEDIHTITLEFEQQHDYGPI